jgi:hypothetical protein
LRNGSAAEEISVLMDEYSLEIMNVLEKRIST